MTKGALTPFSIFHAANFPALPSADFRADGFLECRQLSHDRYIFKHRLTHSKTDLRQLLTAVVLYMWEIVVRQCCKDITVSFNIKSYRSYFCRPHVFLHSCFYITISL